MSDRVAMDPDVMRAGPSSRIFASERESERAVSECRSDLAKAPACNIPPTAATLIYRQRRTLQEEKQNVWKTSE